MDDVYLEQGLLKRCLAGNRRLLSRNEIMMPSFREKEKEGRKAWACRGKLQQRIKKGCPQFVTIWTSSEESARCKEASAGGFRQEMDLVHM